MLENLLLGSIVAYILYSILWIFIAEKNNVPIFYTEWKECYPSFKKRVILFLISGFIVQIVIFCTFILSYTCTSVERFFNWLSID